MITSLVVFAALYLVIATIALRLFCSLRASRTPARCRRSGIGSRNVNAPTDLRLLGPPRDIG